MIRSGEEERTRSREKEKITGGDGTWESRIRGEEKRRRGTED